MFRGVRQLVRGSALCAVITTSGFTQQPTVTTPPAAGSPAGMPGMPGGPPPTTALGQKAAGRWQLLSAWSKMPDIDSSGPYPATYGMAADGAEFVVYQPKDLAGAASKRKLGVYVWGNSGCVNDGASARFHLIEIASRGYVVIAPGKILSGPKAAPPPPDVKVESAKPSQVPDHASWEKMIAALDWIFAENNRSASPYFGLIDAERVAIAGNSCGGLIAIRAALDPRAKTLILENSGTFPSDGPMGKNPAFNFVTKDDVAKLHTPTLYILGGPEDIAEPNGLSDFERIQRVPVFVADQPGAGHVGLFLEPHGEATKLELDWLAWHFDGDRIAAQTFVGPDCVLCRDFRWVVYRKNIN